MLAGKGSAILFKWFCSSMNSNKTSSSLFANADEEAKVSALGVAPHWIEELASFLRFASISTDPVFRDECRRCVEWLGAKLRSLGFTVEIIPTVDHPLLFAQRPGKVGLPRVLYYGHYDVQPGEPLVEWDSPPFSPQVRGGRIYARGAVDNKGQTFFVLKALEALVSEDALGVPVTLLIEGAEESGSLGITEALSELAPRIQGDVLLVCDTTTVSEGCGTITMGLRGSMALEVTVRGPKYDLHSGFHGGVAPNPAFELARLLTLLHSPNGAIAIPGYYDAVEPISAAERPHVEASSISDADYEKEVGVPPCGGEQDRTLAERRGFRPTIEINGMWSGYTGEGHKGIIPAFAAAKLSSRLVAKQNTERCSELLRSFLTEQVKAPFSLEIKPRGAPSAAFRADLNNRFIKLAQRVLEDQFRSPARLLWDGGSIPVLSRLSKVSGAAPVLVGFSVEEDRMHAPNESFLLQQFARGFHFVKSYIQELNALESV